MRRLGWLFAALTVGLAVARIGVLLDDAGAPAAVAGMQNPEPGLTGALAELLLVSVFAGVGAIVTSRRPGNPIGWLLTTTGAGFALLLFAERLGFHLLLGGDGGAGWVWLANWVWIVAVTPLFVGISLLFPTGRPTSRGWGRVLRGMIAVIAVFTLAEMFAPGPLENYPSIENPVGGPAVLLTLRDVSFGFLLVGCLVSVSSLFFRFRRARGIEREQMKWVWAAGGALIVTFVINGVFGESYPTVAGNIFLIGILGMPIAIGLAMLRLQLYDVDVVVNRTLVYAALTASLAAVYLGGVLLFGLLLAPITSDSGLAVAISTLAVAALFRPARARIQALVDRRFYRRRYDAVRTLDAFNARLRDEIDLDSLVRELGSVVETTVQPTHVSLWLRGSDPGAAAQRRGPRDTITVSSSTT